MIVVKSEEEISRIADACRDGKERLAEKQQAEADKEAEVKSEVETVSSELKPGERKVISDGTDGPVVEIIKRTSAEAFEDGEKESAEHTSDADAQDEVGE